MNGQAITYSTDQNLGLLTVNSLGNTIALNGNNRSVTFNGLAPRGDGATLDVRGGPNTGGDVNWTLGVDRFLRLTGQQAGYIGPWLTIDGGSLAVYDTTVGLRAMTAGTTANDYATTITEGRHVRLPYDAPMAIASSAKVESLTIGGAQYEAFVTLAPDVTLTLNQGALMKNGYYPAAIGGGKIASGTDTMIVGVDLNGGELQVGSELVLNAGGLVKTGGGYLSVSGKVSGTGGITLRNGTTTMLGDHTGQGAGRTITVEGGNARLMAETETSLGDFGVVLTKGGVLSTESVSSIPQDILIGAGGGTFFGNGTLTLKGVIRTDYKAGTTVNFSQNVTLGGGATDTRPNQFSTFSLLSVSAPLVLNKAAGVQALAGDILLSGGLIKLLADEQMAPTVQIATISGTSIDLNGHAQTLSYLGTSSGSSVKLETGGSLTLVGTNLNISALGSITGAGKVTMRSVGQTLKGADTFSGGLFIESGVTSLQNARTITGGVTLRGGVMTASADNALGAAANPVNFDGGTWSTAPLTASAHPINILAGGGTIDTGSTNLTLSGAIGGTAANGALHKRGTATLTMNGDSNFGGRIVADAGTVTLGGAGRLLGSSALQSTPTGAVTINSPTSAIAADQIAATSTLYAGGGTISYVNNSTAGANETTGSIVPSGGATTLAITNSQAGQATLTIGTFGQRGGGATVNFAAPSLGANNRFLIPDHADGFMGGWVLANGTGFAKYSAANGGVVAMDAADYAADFALPDTHVRISATPEPKVGEMSIASLSVNAAGLVSVKQEDDATPTTLTISSGGFYKDGAGAFIIIGGNLTAPAGGDLAVHASGGETTIASAIIGDMTLTKSGAGKLRLTGSTNTYTGSTYVNQGTLELATTAGSNAAVTGDVFVNGGTLRLAASEQIADSATVTLNSGTFDLNGFNETVANFANNGGTFTASGGRLTVLSEHTATLSSGATTIGTGQIIDATGLRITGGANTVAAGGLINVFRTTPDGEVSGGLTLNGADPAITLTGSGAAGAGTIALGGEVTVSATGVAKLSTSGGTLPGQVNLRGTRVFNVNSELEVSAKLYGGERDQARAGDDAAERLGEHGGRVGGGGGARGHVGGGAGHRDGDAERREADAGRVERRRGFHGERGTGEGRRDRDDPAAGQHERIADRRDVDRRSGHRGEPVVGDRPKWRLADV